MKKDFIKIWGLAVIVASMTIFVFTMINIYITGQNYGVPYRQIIPAHHRSTDAFIEKLQEQNLWVNLQKINTGAYITMPAFAYKYIPNILPKIENPTQLKNTFVSVLLPLVLIANAEIEVEREFIAYIQNKQGNLKFSESVAWKKILHRYKCKDEDFACLNLKVQPVPTALAISQGAIESGWGTSRFARHGNALFGQWTNEKSSQYIEAAESSADNPVKLRAFNNLLSSVRSYMLNLNTHRAYREFRSERLQFLNSNITYEHLLKTLERYAEKKNYSALLFSISRSNNFQHLNNAALKDDTRL